MSAASLNLTNVPHEAARPRPGAAAHASRASSTTHENTAGRLDVTGWEGVEDTDPAIDRALFDHEFGAPLDAVPPIGAVS